MAATRDEVQALDRSEGEAGKTLSSAPESIKKCFPECRSKMEIEDGEEEDVVGKGEPAAATSNRPCRFPKPAVFFGSVHALDNGQTCSYRPSPRTLRGKSKEMATAWSSGRPRFLEVPSIEAQVAEHMDGTPEKVPRTRGKEPRKVAVPASCSPSP